ncbi:MULTISPECIES: hypothetical protein [Pseudomonas]|jgi:hypothetical protein|uniref:hypothetical protein n=1 Tax=Pseudomonas TaxID=286 RepID=UPI00137499C3|nr:MULTISPECIES: hypothetical protein [unclassified Pseudomonas]MDD1003631.1 hypothetical protein [Pseudomonas sp. TNT2022 ID642]NCE85295.1 hypothetical protein [Pseudomonas sp. Q1]
MKNNQKVRSGNRTVITYDGFQVGFVKSVRMNDDYAPEAASGIGDIHVGEWVPTMARHTITVSRLILETDKMRERGIFAENGDAVLQGLVFDIETYNRDDGSLLRKYTGCSYASGDMEVTAHQILIGSGQFNALDVGGTGG